jgi:hypothetical protein
VIVAISVAAGACFGASIYAALVAVGAKSACGECLRWRLVAAGRMADIDERDARIAELVRLNEALILGAVEGMDEFEW